MLRKKLSLNNPKFINLFLLMPKIKVFKMLLIAAVFFILPSVASAAESLPFKRMLSVHGWGPSYMLSSKAKIDKVINDAEYVGADAIVIQMGNEYFEAERNPSRAGWDTRASWNMLEYIIDKAHAKGIRAHILIGVNIVNNKSRAEYHLFGPSAGYPYNNMDAGGNKDISIPYRMDMTFTELQDYEIDLISWVVRHYSTLDGIDIEEPLYYTWSYSTAVRNRVQAKFGYDIRSSTSGKTLGQIKKDISSVQRDGWNEFFTKLRTAINANKSNPNLIYSVNSWEYVFHEAGQEGLDVKYLADNHLIDYFLLQNTGTGTGGFNFANWKNKTANISAAASVPVVSFAYIKHENMLPDDGDKCTVEGAIQVVKCPGSPTGETIPQQCTRQDDGTLEWFNYKGTGKCWNQGFFDEVKYACDPMYPAKAVGIFSQYYFGAPLLFSKNIRDTLHNMPIPSSCGCSTIISSPTFSPSPLDTYTSARDVSIATSTPGATIYYTLDGSDPASSSTRAIYSAPITVSSTTTIKAKAFKDGLTPSVTASATYTIVTDAVSAPEFSPAAGTYTSAQDVTISTTTTGATIHYTLDGTTPTETSPLYTTTPITISSTTTLKAGAWKTGMTPSSITSAIYTIGTLVNLAPNPGFETDPAVNYDHFGSSTFSWASDYKHAGEKSLKIVSSQPIGQFARWISKREQISAIAGKTYTASVWMKTSGLRQYGELLINFWDNSQNYLNKYYISNHATGTTDWTKLTVSGIAPANTKYIRAEFRLYGPGTVWIDDAEVK